MCGFVFAVSGDSPVDPKRAEVARDVLSHRGPDDSGVEFLQHGKVALGHRRLSILDLSEAGHQPMKLGSLWVVYNGEIYNYPDLRKRLEGYGHQFVSHCDTEVLLHGYRQWGRDLPKHLMGMFSFCLWDDERQHLFAARDHAGQKPLFYFCGPKQLIVASEPKAIFALLGGRPKLRREAVKEFFVYEDIPDPFTWYEGLMSLPPGYCFELSAQSGLGEPTLSEYWTFRPPETPVHMSGREALDALDGVLSRSIGMHLLADVEVGAFLSGGLDSAGVVALTALAKHGDPVKTYSIGYEGDEGELPLARQIATQWGCTHHEGMLDGGGLHEAFDRSLDVFDMPFGDSSQFPTHEVAKLAVRDVKVVLTGDGGDEVFGGYWSLGKYLKGPRYDTSSVFELLYGIKHRRELKRQWQSTYNFHMIGNRSRANGWLGEEFADLKDYDELWFYKKHWLPELDPFRRAQWNAFKCYLPTVLKKVDRCTMQHSLEARAPLLSTELIECMFSLPTPIRNPKGAFKHLYRRLLKGRELVPATVLDGPKRGFSVSSVVYDELRASERLWTSINAARNSGWINASGHVAAQESWARAWGFALIGRALEEGQFS